MDTVDGLALAERCGPADIVVIFEKSRQLAAARKAFGRSFPQAVAMDGHAFRCVSPDEDDTTLQDWAGYHILVPKDRNFRWVFNENGPPDQVKRRREALRLLKKALPKAKYIIIATDYDEEGEWIAWAPLIELGVTIEGDGNRILRAHMTNTDPTNMRRAFMALKPAQLSYGKALAGKTRAEADMALGFTLTRADTTALRPPDAPRQADPVVHGRVKNGLLGILCAREHAVRTFVASDYFEILAETSVPGLMLVHRPKPPLQDRERAEHLAAALAGLDVPLAVTQKEKRKGPPKPFNTTTLQKFGSRRLGWSAKKVDEVAQRLYLAGLISYPRGEGEVLDEGEAKATAPELLDMIRQFWPQWQLPDTPILRSTVFNQKAADAVSHTAIIPNIHAEGGLLQAANGLSGDEAKLFELVCERYAQSLCPDEIRAATDITVTVQVPGVVEPITLGRSGSVVVDPGWTGLSTGTAADAETDQSETGVGSLPQVSDGQVVRLGPAAPDTKTTTPPKRISVDDLSSEMNDAHKHVQDPQLRAVMKGRNGIGTGATRSTIIDEVFKHGMVVQDGAYAVPSERQYRIWEIHRENNPILYDPGWSALWEQQFGRLATDEVRPAELLDILARDLEHHVDIIRRQTPLPASFFSGAAKPASGRAKSPVRKRRRSA